MVTSKSKFPTFELWWDNCGRLYEAAVVKGGGVPWPLDPEKRGAIAERLGLPEDSEPMVLRRALWEARSAA